ncbi:polymerase delta-interacting protein 2-like [Macrosteles quadrilineatus]|uniref:polymerase delta-interacting protein 2-like n=1 Tax=Macrosteles quadrilineatus TaxID=74068 RepID=UPI0023E2998E|nr:polymerase delta-interacting protein 2-like [Macrosteles quadrilineatus]
MSQLVEVGKLETPNTPCYQAGQLFIHKLFAYRGVIVLPCIGQVFDLDVNGNSGDTHFNMERLGGKDVKCYTKNYYEALIDMRDRPFCRIVNEMAIPKHAASKNDKRLMSCPGLDHLSHDDIIPYKATEQVPFRHEMLGEFFDYTPANEICFEPKDVLKSSLGVNAAFNMKIDVYKRTNDNVKITVIPTYLGYRNTESTTTYSWNYSVQLENMSDSSIRILKQNWKVTSLHETTDEVFCRGVMGEEVTIDSRAPVFKFISNVNLPTPFGHMIGNFKIEKQDLTKCLCPSPLFLLKSCLEVL